MKSAEIKTHCIKKEQYLESFSFMYVVARLSQFFLCIYNPSCHTLIEFNGSSKLKRILAREINLRKASNQLFWICINQFLSTSFSL